MDAMQQLSLFFSVENRSVKLAGMRLTVVEPGKLTRLRGRKRKSVPIYSEPCLSFYVPRFEMETFVTTKSRRQRRRRWSNLGM